MSSRRPWATILACAALVVSLTGQPASGDAQTAGGGLSVWDGVYTAAQADRGSAVYASHCSRCHGEESAGRENPLNGERFADRWEARTLADLFGRFAAMPPGASAAVATADKRDAMAYVLRQNGFPEGSAELPSADEGLAAIRITGRNGPAPIKTGTLVKVAGCLRAGADGREWALTEATEPERTVLPAPPSDREPPAAPGTRRVTLLNVFPNPTAHQGHTMRAVGFLVRDASGDRVNVVSLDLVAPSCAREHDLGSRGAGRERVRLRACVGNGTGKGCSKLRGRPASPTAGGSVTRAHSDRNASTGSMRDARLAGR